MPLVTAQIFHPRGEGLNRSEFVKLVAATTALPTALMSASPRILVVGDSVTWGQGLLPSEKMHRLLARMLFDRDGVEPQILNYAHSGAIVGFVNGVPTSPLSPSGWWPPEIPRAYPTVLEQLLQALSDHPDARYDAIIVSASINDVSVQTIFNPTTQPDVITSRCAQYCHDAMVQLLTVIHQ